LPRAECAKYSLLTWAISFSTIRGMIKLTDEMREAVNNALANGCPCVLATAGADGEPDIGYKGSMMIFDDQSLAYWERTRRQHLKNVTANPKVVVLFRDGKTRVNWRFHGMATVHDAGPIRDQVMARVVPPELEKDPQRKGSAVIIQVDKVTNLGGEVLQSR
jgi:hypothetical protein